MKTPAQFRSFAWIAKDTEDVYDARPSVVVDLGITARLLKQYRSAAAKPFNVDAVGRKMGQYPSGKLPLSAMITKDWATHFAHAATFALLW